MRIKLGHFDHGGEIARILCVPEPVRDLPISHLCTDSREVERGDLFVCLAGERYDGHRYIGEARARGASLFLCHDGTKGKDVIAVRDTLAALGALATEVRRSQNPTVIGVTGSVGKTTTKEMIAAVLAREYPTHKTKENQNNLLGLSLSILSMPRSSRYLVLEMGMNHTREIATLSALARPDVAVITNVGQAHIGHLGSREAIARAKLEILEGCDGGTPYFYPAEEPLLLPPCHAATIPFPIAARRGADNAYFDVSSVGGYTRFSLDFRRWRYEGLRVRGTGAHMAACAAFAVCIGDLMGVSHEGIADALLHYEENKMRGGIRDVCGVTVIEDCYNASPESMAAALSVLLQIAKEKGGRAFALLGGMRELGEHSPTLHRALGVACAEAELAYLFPFGTGAREIAEGALGGGIDGARIFCNEDEGAPEESAAEIAAHIRAGDVLLIKGSRATGCERVCDALSKLLERKEGEA